MWFGIITNFFTNTNGYFLLMSKMYFSTIFPCPVNCGRGRSRLPPRSVLLLRRGVHWTPAPLPYNVAENFCFIIGTYRNKIISVFAIIKIFESSRFSFSQIHLHHRKYFNTKYNINQLCSYKAKQRAVSLLLIKTALSFYKNDFRRERPMCRSVK